MQHAALNFLLLEELEDYNFILLLLSAIVGFWVSLSQYHTTNVFAWLFLLARRYATAVQNSARREMSKPGG